MPIVGEEFVHGSRLYNAYLIPNAQRRTRFLGAKEQAKEDMRIRRERRRQKALANRGHSEDTESAGASTIAANERHERAVEARREKEARYQALADKDGAISPDVTREADAHTKLSNMYMDAMQAKMDELNSMES